jgi:hypothetical protein
MKLWCRLEVRKHLRGAKEILYYFEKLNGVLWDYLAVHISLTNWKLRWWARSVVRKWLHKHYSTQVGTPQILCSVFCVVYATQNIQYVMNGKQKRSCFQNFLLYYATTKSYRWVLVLFLYIYLFIYLFIYDLFNDSMSSLDFMLTFEEYIDSIIRVERISKLVFLHSVLQLLITANVPSSLILSTLMLEVIHSSKILVLTRATWCHILEDGILHGHHHETVFESYKSILVSSSLSFCGYCRSAWGA